MRTQIVEVPVYVTISDAIDISKKLITFKGGDITKEALASTLGHKNIKSGTFSRKVADLKKYGLLEGRGDAYRATDLANKIAFAPTENERNEAVLEMINNIDIIKKLAEVLPHDAAIPENEIRTKLINITKERPDKLQPIMAIVSKLYKDAVPYIGVIPMATGQSGYSASQQSTQNRPQQPTQEGTILFVADKINLSLTETIPNLELIKTAIENRIKDLRQMEGKKGKEGEAVS